MSDPGRASGDEPAGVAATAETASSQPTAACLSALHELRTRPELSACLEGELLALLGETSFALLIFDEQEDRGRVEIACGEQCPLVAGEEVAQDAWKPSRAVRLPLVSRDYAIGELVLAGPLEAGRRAPLEILLQHYSVAFLNLRLNESTKDTVDAYCASLQAYEQGIALFQEADAGAIAARFLDLCMSVLSSTAGAVYVLERIGDTGSELVLDQSWGLPESLLVNLVEAETGEWWPAGLIGGRVILLEREEAGSMPRLDNEKLPAPVHNVLGAPLSYHGVDVGVCVLFNVRGDANLIDGTRRLFELGAAIFHRRELEAESLRNQELKTQLEIASILQARFIPDMAPSHERMECAWRSVPAQFIGGDYVDFVEAEDGAIHAVVADVSGHGVNSALIMTSFRALYRAKARLFDPYDTLTRANMDIFEEVGDTGMFLTAVAVRIAHEGSSVQLASAGHNPVYLYRPSSDEFFSYEASGPPVGFFAGTVYEDQRIEVQVGDYLVLYTDGVVEAAAEGDREMFGDERLQEIVRRHAPDGPAVVLEHLYEAVAAFSGREREIDDVSVLILRFR